MLYGDLLKLDRLFCQNLYSVGSKISLGLAWVIVAFHDLDGLSVAATYSRCTGRSTPNNTKPHQATLCQARGRPIAVQAVTTNATAIKAEAAQNRRKPARFIHFLKQEEAAFQRKVHDTVLLNFGLVITLILIR